LDKAKSGRHFGQFFRDFVNNTMTSVVEYHFRACNI